MQVRPAVTVHGRRGQLAAEMDGEFRRRRDRWTTRRPCRAGSRPALLFLLLMGCPPVLVRICAVSPADWMASRKEKIVAMDFVSALRRIAEVIELEKPSGGAVQRLRPTAGEESRVPAKPGGFSPSPTSFRSASKNLGPTLVTARLPVPGPAGKLANLPEGVSVDRGRIEGCGSTGRRTRGAAVIARACARERLRAVRDGAGGRDAGQLRAARLPSYVSRCDVQVLQVTAGSNGSRRRDSGEPANFRADPR